MDDQKIEEYTKYACTLGELKYIELMKKHKQHANISEAQCLISLFPMGWFNFEDYKTKINFLKEAISKDIELSNIDECAELFYPKGMYID